LDTQDTSHPFQLPEWSTSDNSVYLLGAFQGVVRVFGRGDLIWPLGRRFDSCRALTLTRGPVCDDPSLMRTALQQLKEICRARGLLYVDVSPDVTGADAQRLGEWFRSAGWLSVGLPSASLRVDLRPDLESIHGSFRKTTRHEIRKAERASMKITEALDEGCCEQFLALYFAMSREKGFMPDPEAHMRRILSWLHNNRQRGTLLTARDCGNMLGGVVAVRAGSRCWYVWGATRKQTGNNVGHLLQWRAMQWAKEQGCTEYDLGGYREGAMDGPALFKRGFSGRVVRFLPVFRYVANPIAYSAFQVLRATLTAARSLMPSRGAAR
jgi:peptidoglycan pentaglycine glycine transferase (the first glycine)